MMSQKEELLKWVTLCRVRGIGSSKVMKLLNIFGKLELIFSASKSDLLKTRVFSEEMIIDFINLKEKPLTDFENILNYCEENNITIIPLFSDKYPQQLKLVPDAPLIIFALGNLELLKTKKIAMVGSRESSDEAKKWAFENAQLAATKGITLVSGGAKGIDYAAHNGALDVNGKTICVVGTGFNRLYPEEHKEMFEKIKKNGLLLSEYDPDYIGGRISLLRRNRIISGISDALVLVTSSNVGGSMAQLKIAHKQRIQIFCPSASLKLTPDQGIQEAVKTYNAIQINDVTPVLKFIEKPTLF